MKLLKSIIAVIITFGFLAATSCSYKTCPAYTKYTTPESNQPLVASQHQMGK